MIMLLSLLKKEAGKDCLFNVPHHQTPAFGGLSECGGYNFRIICMAYAENTSVSTDKSRSEIERTLQRYGADQFMYGWDRSQAVVGFRMAGRQIKFLLPMPDKNDIAFTHTPTGKERVETAAHKEWEQACRQKWRALSLVIKAKLEAVDAGIAIFEDEFMANIVLPNGSTVSQFMLPQIHEAYESGSMPKMLPDLR